MSKLTFNLHTIYLQNLAENLDVKNIINFDIPDMPPNLLNFLKVGFPDGNRDLFLQGIKKLPGGSTAVWALADNLPFMETPTKSIDLDLEFLEKLAKNHQYQNLLFYTPSSVRTPESALKFKKLIPLTFNYLDELEKGARNLTGKAKAAIDKKIVLVNGLADCLLAKEPDAQIVKSFYTKLNAAEKELSEHRDPQWQRYVRNAVIAAGILITGILPGLIALAIYVNSGFSDGKSFKFWQSTGENFVEQLKDPQHQSTPGN